MASTNFTSLAKHLATGAINFDTDTFKALLVSSILTTTQTTGDMDAWVTRADVTNEVAGTGYAAGGFDCTPVAAGTLDLVNNKFVVDLADGAPAFTGSSISAVGAIVYKSTGTNTTDLLVSFVDFGGTITSTAGDFNVTFNTPLEITV